RFSLGLFPLFWAAGLAIIRFQAAGFVARDGPFHSAFGARLTPVDMLTSAATLFLYYQALRNRRSMLTHAAALLAMPLFLLPPILGRLLQILPPFAIHDASQMGRFAVGLHLSNALAILIGLALYARRPSTAWPFLAAALWLLLETLAFETLGRSKPWEALMAPIAAIHPFAVVATGLVTASFVAWLGWIHGRSRSGRDALAAETGGLASGGAAA
ncbi:MAG: hypothetical protein JWO25_2053, partial [Alphaproteobacteria bacterium]|nr:hypothetical protein [Alphaproteobacteria bacterium]